MAHVKSQSAPLSETENQFALQMAGRSHNQTKRNPPKRLSTGGLAGRCAINRAHPENVGPGLSARLREHMHTRAHALTLIHTHQRVHVETVRSSTRLNFSKRQHRCGRGVSPITNLGKPYTPPAPPRGAPGGRGWGSAALSFVLSLCGSAAERKRVGEKDGEADRGVAVTSLWTVPDRTRSQMPGLPVALKPGVGLSSLNPAPSRGTPPVAARRAGESLRRSPCLGEQPHRGADSDVVDTRIPARSSRNRCRIPGTPPARTRTHTHAARGRTEAPGTVRLSTGLTSLHNSLAGVRSSLPGSERSGRSRTPVVRADGPASCCREIRE